MTKIDCDIATIDCLLISQNNLKTIYIAEALSYDHRRRVKRIVESEGEDILRNFGAVAIDISDLQPFKDMILTRIDATGLLRPAVGHFGWGACLVTIAKRVCSTATLRGRVSLIGSVIDASSGAARINSLLEPLLSLHPWTDVKVDASAKVCCESGYPYTQSFTHLLNLAIASSPEKLWQTVSVSCPKALIEVVVPTLRRLKDLVDRAAWLPLVHHVSGLVEKAKDAARNEVFSKVRLPMHCSNCDRMQAVLTSTATEATIPLTGSTSQIKHLQSVLKHHVEYSCSVTVRATGDNTARLTKKPGDYIHDPSEQVRETLTELIQSSDERRDLGRRFSWE